MPRIAACAKDATDPEDRIRFGRNGPRHAICHAPGGGPHAMGGPCSQERGHRSGGPAMADRIIACPQRNGRFDDRTGVAVRPPCVAPRRAHRTRVAGDPLDTELE